MAGAEPSLDPCLAALPARSQFVHHNWPLFLEFVCSYILTVVAFNCRANPPTLGLVYAGLAHMASTSTYYLQANPILTLAQFARGHFDIVKCALVSVPCPAKPTGHSC